MLENGFPSATDHRLGRYRQALTAPGVVARAEGGTKMETNFCKLLVVKDAGDDATNTRRRNFGTRL